jgi:transposase-like protein
MSQVSDLLLFQQLSMVFQQISEDIKNRALLLFENGYIPEDISELLAISERSFRRWKRNQLEFGSVIPPHRPNQDRP